jgi:hypothetical protein
MKLSGELRADASELPPAKQRQHVGAIDHAMLFLTGELLLDQPSATLGQGVAHVPPEACVAGRRFAFGDKLAIKPGGALGTDLTVERQGRERLDRLIRA